MLLPRRRGGGGGNWHTALYRWRRIDLADSPGSVTPFGEMPPGIHYGTAKDGPCGKNKGYCEYFLKRRAIPARVMTTSAGEKPGVGVGAGVGAVFGIRVAEIWAVFPAVTVAADCQSW